MFVVQFLFFDLPGEIEAWGSYLITTGIYIFAFMLAALGNTLILEAREIKWFGLDKHYGRYNNYMKENMSGSEDDFAFLQT